MDVADRLPLTPRGRGLEPGGLEGLDPKLVAAAVDGVIDDHDRRRLEALVHADPETLLLVRALRDERRRARRRPWLLAGAGGAVVAAVLTVVLLTGTRAEPETQPALQARLATAVARLRAEHPDRFAALGREVVSSLAPRGVTRGAGAAWLGPRGVVLAAPSDFEWRLPQGSTRVRIEISGPDTSFQREVEGSRLAAPPLGAGRYVVQLVPLDGLARQAVRSAFTVLDDDERRAWEADVDAFRAVASADVADLLVAMWARERGLLEVARSTSERAAAAGGELGEAAERLLRQLGD